jgi:hypothetical protein
MSSTVSAPTGLDIDHIVRDVLAVLNPPVSDVMPVTAAAPDLTNNVWIDSRVVSLADVKARLGTAQKIFVSPKSILTPSARDELRKQNVEIIRSVPKEKSAETVFWWAVQPYSAISDSQRSRLQKKLLLPPESFADLPELLTVAEKRLTDSNACGVILTPQTASALYLACRSMSLRPILGFYPQQIQEDTAELRANLLILSPCRLAEAKILEIVKQFVHSCNGGIRMNTV